eukprot:126354_1
MICSYSSSNDIITIIGGRFYYPKSVYQFNITSNIFRPLTDLNQNAYSCYANGAVTLNNHMYFTNCFGFYQNTSNFFVYDITNNNLVKQGNINPKPESSYKECYTTDYKQYIYIIGGSLSSNSDYISTTYIYDINQHEWSNGPHLNTARHSAACTYNKIDDTIYVFGAWNGRYLNNIEIYDTKHSNSYTTLTTRLTFVSSSVNAFMMSDSNIIFVIGSASTNMFCNIYSVNTKEINLCPTTYGNTWYYYGVNVETDELRRYYAFGISSSNIIHYAIIGPSIVSFSSPVNIVSNRERLPIDINKISDKNAAFNTYASWRHTGLATLYAFPYVDDQGNG